MDLVDFQLVSTLSCHILHLPSQIHLHLQISTLHFLPCLQQLIDLLSRDVGFSLPLHILLPLLPSIRSPFACSSCWTPLITIIEVT
jgi:hypothetical protein